MLEQVSKERNTAQERHFLFIDPVDVLDHTSEKYRTAVANQDGGGDGLRIQTELTRRCRDAGIKAGIFNVCFQENRTVGCNCGRDSKTEHNIHVLYADSVVDRGLYGNLNSLF